MKDADYSGKTYVPELVEDVLFWRKYQVKPYEKASFQRGKTLWVSLEKDDINQNTNRFFF